MPDVDIPYSVTPRPDTGVTNATLAMWLFIASEVMLFGALLSSYVLLRLGAPSWPDQSGTLNVPLATLNTVILLASSAAIVTASRASRAASIARCRVALTLTILGGVLFLGIKGVEYTLELRQGLRPSTNNFLGLYFTLTGLHALHVLGGICVNLVLLVMSRRMWPAAANRFTVWMRAATLYWNFVDVVWLVLFPTLYLL